MPGNDNRHYLVPRLVTSLVPSLPPGENSANTQAEMHDGDDLYRPRSVATAANIDKQVSCTL